MRIFKLKGIVIVFCLAFIACPLKINSQIDVSKKLATAVIGPEKSVTLKRSILKVQSSSGRYNPFVYVGAALLFVYQNVISEQIQAHCMYKVSCSQFTKLAIQKKGFLEGTLLGFNQISECFPGILKEHSDYCIDQNDKINNSNID